MRSPHIQESHYERDIVTCRDVAHRRLIEEKMPLPVDIRGGAILHAGPIIKPLDNDKFQMVSVGPTTSMRMEKFEYEFIRETGVKLVVGKGGMGEGTQKGCKEFSLPQKSRRSRMPSGGISVCRRRCGYAV